MVKLRVHSEGSEWILKEVKVNPDFTLSLEGSEFTLDLSKDETLLLISSLTLKSLPVFVIEQLNDYIKLSLDKGERKIAISDGSTS